MNFITKIKFNFKFRNSFFIIIIIIMKNLKYIDDPSKAVLLKYIGKVNFLSF